LMTLCFNRKNNARTLLFQKVVIANVCVQL
jgi:hypothetical protein